jgi:hypothetical protein
MNRAVGFAVILASAAIVQAAEIAPGALVSDDGRTVYVRVPPGALEARWVADGTVRWRADGDLRPLADRGRLVCQRAGREGRLDLVFLDAATGRRRGETTVALPPRVSSPLDEGLGTRFELRTVAAGARALLVWAFERRPVRGALVEAEHDEPGDERHETLRAAGTVSVDLEAERAVVTAPAAFAPLPAAALARAATGALRERPLEVGAFFVATAKGFAGPSLERWTALGQPLAPVVLPAGVTLQRGSADGRHVLVSRERPGAPLAGAHEWTVLALDTGTVVATLRTSVAAAAFEVAGGRTLVALEPGGYRAPSGWRDEPRRLQAFDPTGAPAWTRSLRDPAYRGPVAP